MLKQQEIEKELDPKMFEEMKEKLDMHNKILQNMFNQSANEHNAHIKKLVRETEKLRNMLEECQKQLETNEMKNLFRKIKGESSVASYDSDAKSDLKQNSDKIESDSQSSSDSEGSAKRKNK